MRPKKNFGRAGRLIDPLSNRAGQLIDPLSDSAHSRLVLNRANWLTNGSTVNNRAVTYTNSRGYSYTTLVGGYKAPTNAKLLLQENLQASCLVFEETRCIQRRPGAG